MTAGLTTLTLTSHLTTVTTQTSSVVYLVDALCTPAEAKSMNYSVPAV